MVWCSASALVLINKVNLCRAWLVVGRVTMSLSLTPGDFTLFRHIIDTKVNSAFYPPWDSKMSTSQRAVMFCSWGVKAGMVCLQVKLCVAISECFRKYIWYLNALYKCPGSLYFTLLCCWL